MWTRHAILFAGYLGFVGVAAAAGAQDFTIDDISAARPTDVAQLKPGLSRLAIALAMAASTAKLR